VGKFERQISGSRDIRVHPLEGIQRLAAKGLKLPKKFDVSCDMSKAARHEKRARFRWKRYRMRGMFSNNSPSGFNKHFRLS